MMCSHGSLNAVKMLGAQLQYSFQSTRAISILCAPWSRSVLGARAQSAARFTAGDPHAAWGWHE